MKSPRHLLAYFALQIGAVAGASAAPGDLDPIFGAGGKVTTAIGYSAEGLGIAVQEDGKVIVAGKSWNGNDDDLALARHRTDGTLDPEFGVGGTVTTNAGGYDVGADVAMQSDGKIVVVGSSNGDFLVVRYTTSGALDPDFGTGGIVFTDFSNKDSGAAAVAVQSDGKIVVAGSSEAASFNGRPNDDFALARYMANGELDLEFGTGGKVTTSIVSSPGSLGDFGRSVAIQSDGKIVVAGTCDPGSQLYQFALIRYTASGALDTSFGTGGRVTTLFGSPGNGAGVANGVALQNGGKIVAAGYGYTSVGVPYDFALVRYLADGTLDSGFGTGGKVLTPVGASHDLARSVTVQSDGKILALGEAYNGSNLDFALVRYTTSGALDNTFGTAGKVITAFGNLTDWGFDAAVQNDGKILAAGYSGGSNHVFALARYEGGPHAPYAQWKLANLGDVNAPDTGNPDADAYENLAEYGLVQSPTAFSAGPVGERFTYLEGDRLRIVFTRDPARNDVTIEVLAADDLAGPWTPIASSVLGAVTTGAGYYGGDSTGPGLKTVEVRDLYNIGDAAHPRRFLRQRVSR